MSQVDRIEAEPMSSDERAIAALAKVPPDIALMRMENDAIMSVAMTRPRNIAKIRDELFAMVDAFPESAESAIYNKPVGDVFAIECECGHRYEWPYVNAEIPCPRCDKIAPKTINKVKKFARGLSIRSAENIRIAYGYNRVTSSVDEMGDDKWKITATFVDYSSGNMTQQQQIVTPFFTSRSKVKTRIPDDRFFGVVLKAHESKVIREVVLRSVPGILKAAYFDHCEKTVDGLLTDGKIDEIVSHFAARQVGVDQLEAFLGKPRALGWTKEDRRTLMELWTALKDGEITAGEIGVEVHSDDERAKKPAGADDKLKTDDLMGKKKEAEPETKKEPAKTETAKAGGNAAKTPKQTPANAASAAGMLGVCKGWVDAATDAAGIKLACDFMEKVALTPEQREELAAYVMAKQDSLEAAQDDAQAAEAEPAKKPKGKKAGTQGELLDGQ